MSENNIEEINLGYGSAIIIAIIIFFISRSPFHSIEQLGIIERFFFTNLIYSNGEAVRGAPGALAFIRSYLIFPILALLSGKFWSFSKDKFDLFFLILCGMILLKIALDYYVFGFLFNVDGGFSLFKTLLLIVLIPLFYVALDNSYFKQSSEE